MGDLVSSTKKLFVSLLMITSKIKPICWRFIWILWVLCSFWSWLSSIFGWILKLYIPSFICCILWKLVAFIMLCLCQYMLLTVKHRLQHCLDKKNKTSKEWSKSRMSKNFVNGKKQIQRLMLCEMMLSIFLLLSIVYEIYALFILIKNNGDNEGNIYFNSTVMSMIIYFPVWTSIHIVLLVYLWIKKKPTKKNT